MQSSSFPPVFVLPKTRLVCSSEAGRQHAGLRSQVSCDLWLPRPFSGSPLLLSFESWQSLKPCATAIAAAGTDRLLGLVVWLSLGLHHRRGQKFPPRPTLSFPPKPPPQPPTKFPEALRPLWPDEALAISRLDRAFRPSRPWPFMARCFCMTASSTESWSSKVTRAKPPPLPQSVMICHIGVPALS